MSRTEEEILRKEEEERKKLRGLLLSGSDSRLADELEHIHPADILELLRSEKDDLERARLLYRLPDSMIADIIDEEEEEDKYSLLRLLPEERQKAILEEILPCHLEITYVFWYVTWAQMEARFATWAAIEAGDYTWEEMEKLVE